MKMLIHNIESLVAQRSPNRDIACIRELVDRCLVVTRINGRFSYTVSTHDAHAPVEFLQQITIILYTATVRTRN
ncbi:hypothetical protein D3C73_1271700 [compost metagenome]